VADQLKLAPTSGELFIFRNRQCDKVKLLWYEHNGFWLCYKRLEKGKLVFPCIKTSVIEITRDQLSWLLSGLNFEKQAHLPAYEATQFF
jgi:transposase